MADRVHATHFFFLSQVGAVFWERISSEYLGQVMLMVSNVLHYFLPTLLTLACYLSIIMTVSAAASV